jgi:RNA polymerase sigma-70 factor (ECF subfamily)
VIFLSSRCNLVAGFGVMGMAVAGQEVGVEDGWEQVYAAQYRRLVALVAAVAGSLPEAEDAVQEAFVRGLGLTGRKAVPDNPEAWLYQVAVNLIRSRWRRAVTGRRHQAELADRAQRSEPVDTDSHLALLAALRRLPFDQREALALHYLADLSVDEIAVRAGSPAGTIKARLGRGRGALAKLLDDSVAGGERRA